MGKRGQCGIRSWRAVDAGGPRGRCQALLAAEAVFASEPSVLSAAPRLAAALRRERVRMHGGDYDFTRHWVLSRAIALLAAGRVRLETTKAPPGKG